MRSIGGDNNELAPEVGKWDGRVQVSHGVARAAGTEEVVVQPPSSFWRRKARRTPHVNTQLNSRFW